MLEFVVFLLIFLPEIQNFLFGLKRLYTNSRIRRGLAGKNRNCGLWKAHLDDLVAMMALRYNTEFEMNSEGFTSLISVRVVDLA